jgi:UDP-N-acetylmuramoyl-L-alanyl-D-glutamate--2,6-diaminopimelate ligase
LDAEAFALTNVDDRNGNVVVQNTIANRYSYALKSPADFKVKIIENQLSGLLVNLNGKELSTRLIGRFNAYNLTAVYASAILLNQDELEVLCALSNLSSAEGRFEPYKGSNGVTAIIDYAHTPDALENVLDTILSFKKKEAKLYTVVGCGGNRDVDKRPKMASIAFSKSDYVFFTSDNPRSEDPQEIINQMLSGIQNQEDSNVFEVLDRQQAIKMALSFASENDVVLIAGKGHEKYQEINGVRHHFDDKEIAKKYLKN